MLLAVHLLLGAPLLWLRAPGPLQRVAVCVKGFNIAANDVETKLGREKRLIKVRETKTRGGFALWLRLQHSAAPQYGYYMEGIKKAAEDAATSEDI